MAWFDREVAVHFSLLVRGNMLGLGISLEPSMMAWDITNTILWVEIASGLHYSSIAHKQYTST